nr:unnamed protein product [Callosobruchus analis]
MVHTRKGPHKEDEDLIITFFKSEYFASIIENAIETRTNQLVKKIDTLEEIIQNHIAENLKITTMLEKIHCKMYPMQETRQNNDSHEKHQDKTPRKVDVSKNCTKIFQPDSKKRDAQRQRRRTRNKGRTAVFGNGDKGKSNITAVKRKTWVYVGRIAPATGVRGMKNHCEAVFSSRAVEIELLPQWKNSKTEAFKMKIDQDMLDAVFTSENWPSGALIKMYKFFQKTEGHLV